MRRLPVAVVGFSLVVSTLVLAPPSAIAVLDDPPVITSPTEGAELPGEVTVSATTAAPYVEYWLYDANSALRRTRVATSAGVATTTMETWGLDGPTTLRAVNCTGPTSCGGYDDTISDLVVDHAPLVIDEPAAAVIRSGDDDQSVHVAAHGAGGRLLLLARGSVIASGTGTVEADLDLSALPDGPVPIRVERCGTSDNVCGEAVYGPSVEIWRALHPETSLDTSRISPNGDGTADSIAATVLYQYAVRGPVGVPTRVAWAVTDVQGNEVIPEQVVGTDLNDAVTTFDVDPFAVTGAVLPDGEYRLVTSTAVQINGTTVTGKRTDRFTVNTSGPSTRPTVTPAAFYPVADGYRDYLTAKLNSSEDLLVDYAIVDKAGKAVYKSRTWAMYDVTWDGRNSRGRLVPEGRYRIKFSGTDSLGNPLLAYTSYFTLSHKELVTRTYHRKVTAAASVYDDWSGKCSSLVKPGRPGWRGSVGYLSLSKCSKAAGRNDFAMAAHRVRLPKSHDYMSVKVRAFGAARESGGRDRAVMYWVLNNNKAANGYKLLGAKPRWYDGKSAKAKRVLWRDGSVYWVVYTAVGLRYAVKSFDVQATYQVLR